MSSKPNDMIPTSSIVVNYSEEISSEEVKLSIRIFTLMTLSHIGIPAIVN